MTKKGHYLKMRYSSDLLFAGNEHHTCVWIAAGGQRWTTVTSILVVVRITSAPYPAHPCLAAWIIISTLQLFFGTARAAFHGKDGNLYLALNIFTDRPVWLQEINSNFQLWASYSLRCSCFSFPSYLLIDHLASSSELQKYQMLSNEIVYDFLWFL